MTGGWYMNKYIGCKLVEADEMCLGYYNNIRGWVIPENEDPKKEGYKIIYPDGYVSWSPKEIFEAAYMPLTDESKITISEAMSFVKKIEIAKLGDKTTIVKAELVNGFVIVESSSCVDPNNYNEEIGTSICLKKIDNKIWELLGFLLQTAKNGVCK